MIQYFSDEATDTQGTLFEDETKQELIMAFRGTSSPKDLDTDLIFTLVPLSAPGTKCSDCKVESIPVDQTAVVNLTRSTKASRRPMSPWNRMSSQPSRSTSPAF